MKLMDNGSFNIWTPYFETIVFNADFGHLINAGSFDIDEGVLIIAAITRKNRIVVTQVAIDRVFERYVAEKKFVYPNAYNFRLLVDLELVVLTPHLPNKYNDDIKLRFHNRIICLSDQRFLITSKDGNMYLTDIESLTRIKEDKITL